tara:strand:- start:13135 stop:13884 length:750 start_codon:yes stop_codon:yes gene_type:complete
MINYKYKSTNYNERKGNASIELIVIHYTGVKSSIEDVCNWFSNQSSKVSSHYILDKNGTTYSIVDDKYRAWHAGISYWQGNQDINSISIGIEIHNSGEEDFEEDQMIALINLIKYLIQKYNIKSYNVIGHSDISVNRKIDPGIKFPWQWLSKKGIGIWSSKKGDQYDKFEKYDVSYGDFISDLRSKLNFIGYQLNINRIYDNDLRNVVTAFQRHWRPGNINGDLDVSTVIRINDIYKKIKNLRLTNSTS